MKQKLKEQSPPKKHILDYERRLEKLRHDGLVQEFVKKLSSLILDIDNMYKEDRLFNFFIKILAIGVNGVEEADFKFVFCYHYH